MSSLRHPGILGMAFLAILMVMAGAPAVACAAMPDCPMMAPARGCHGGLGEGEGGHGCAWSRLQAEDCCGITAAQPPAPALSSEVSVASATADVPATAGHSLSAPAPPRPVPDGARPLSRPAGRALLSFQQTFLI